MMQDRVVYAVGDVHGCHSEFVGILKRIGDHARQLSETRPLVVVLGDLIDRGPHSREVLDLACGKDLTSRFDMVFLLGNHERWLLQVLEGLADPMPWLHNGGAETIESYGIDFGGRGVDRALGQFHSVFPTRHREFLCSRRLSKSCGELFFVHAGVDPSLPLRSQKEDAMLWIREPFLDHTDMMEARIVHGHTPTPDVVVLPHRIGVDTGAGHLDGHLSAVAIAPDGGVTVIDQRSQIPASAAA